MRHQFVLPRYRLCREICNAEAFDFLLRSKEGEAIALTLFEPSVSLVVPVRVSCDHGGLRLLSQIGCCFFLSSTHFGPDMSARGAHHPCRSPGNVLVGHIHEFPVGSAAEWNEEFFIMQLSKFGITQASSVKSFVVVDRSGAAHMAPRAPWLLVSWCLSFPVSVRVIP